MDDTQPSIEDDLRSIRAGHQPRWPELDQGKGGPTGQVCNGHGWGFPPPWPCREVRLADEIDRLRA